MDTAAIIKNIESLDARRTEALLAGDIDQLESFIGSSLHYVHSSGTDEDRATYLQRLRDGFYQYLALQSSERDIRVFGDSVTVNGIIRVHVIVNGTEKDFTARYMQVWVTENSAWKMIGWQTTLLPTS